MEAGPSSSHEQRQKLNRIGTAISNRCNYDVTGGLSSF